MLDLTNLANYQITKTSKTTKTSQILKLSDHSILNLTNYQITKSMNAISALYLGKLTLGWGEAQDEWLLLLWTQDISRTLWIVALFFGCFCCGCRISLTISGVSYPCAICFCCGRRIFLTLQPASTRLKSFNVVLSPFWLLLLWTPDISDIICVIVPSWLKAVLWADRQTRHLERPFRCFEAETN